ncbi:hypothetical protein MIZ03_2515 [Rhodoferax lithotrophicus]|uniref:Acyltransferase n=1 Tax=Rhodoferax lithotrophicus TaxID=2798804 RepID=A0ABM7MMZ8_9BURK|nr:acyltransferase family protein [Rhodoferax sp. MIZ03]BCO27626.1 hypothetical protein MIZ03_2515 [Rhodoferax sp. MIZ03]
MKDLVQAADFRPDINALRAFAVLAVVAYHYGMPGAQGGFAGVDVFFVISGFLIGSHILAAHQRGHFSFAGFFRARLRRIFPALAVMCAACLLWGWWFVLPYDYLKSTRHVMAALFFLSNLAFTGEQGYFDLAAHAKPLLHTWSLSVEGQFYAVLPVLMALVWRWARQHLRLVLGLLWLASLLWALWAGQTHPADAFYGLLTRAWEFLSGCLLGAWRPVWKHPRWCSPASALALLLLLGSFAGLSPAMNWPGPWTLLPVGAAVLWMAAGDAPVTARIWRSWPLQRLGDVSYSFYLWHWPVLVFARQYVQSPSGDLTRGMLLELVALSLVLAVLSWRWVEQPTRLRTGWWTARRLLGGVLTVWLLVLLFGVLVIKTRGVPQRLPDYVQRASAAVFFNTPRDECFRRGDSTKDAPEPFCHFGAGSSAHPQLLLWGDSHANQYLSALTDAALALGQGGLIATQSGCRATLPGQVTGLPESIAQTCAGFNDEVNTLLVQTPSIHTVVLGRLWSSDASFNRTVALVQQLARHGKRVLLIGPLPEPGMDVPQNWSVQQLKAGHAIDKLTIPLSSQANALAIRTRLRVELADQVCRGQVVLLDPIGSLCDDKVCRLAQGGEANFRDVSHLSQQASLQFTQPIQVALSALNSARVATCSTLP